MGLLSCPGCGAALKFKLEQAGRRVKCPKCETPLTVPDIEDDPLFSIDTTTITPPPIMQPPVVPRPGPNSQSSEPNTMGLGSAARPISSTGPDSPGGLRDRHLPLYLQPPPASPSPGTSPPKPNDRGAPQ